MFQNLWELYQEDNFGSFPWKIQVQLKRWKDLQLLKDLVKWVKSCKWIEFYQLAIVMYKFREKFKISYSNILEKDSEIDNAMNVIWVLWKHENSSTYQ